jgi:HD-GYP domain-containing protein (c-di-GMP phosphodiesterase class II)
MPMTLPTANVPAWHALRSLSHGLDLAMGRRAGHAQATARLSLIVGERLGLAPDDLDALILAALLKDAG